MKNAFLTGILIYAATVFGQNHSTSLLFDHAVFQNYSMKDGLSSNYCYDVLQDSKGTIWIATLNGLNRFNGNRWETFQQQAETKNRQLPANWVIDVDEEKNKGIWINTDRGIAFYNFAGDSIYRYADPVKGWGRIISVGADQILVSSWTGLELFRKKGSTLHSIRSFPETAKNSFPFLYRGWDGSIWTCPEDRPSLVHWNPTSGTLNYITHFYLQNKQISPVVRGIFQLNAKQLLLTTRQHGLLIYTIGTNRVRAFFPEVFVPETDYSQVIRYRVGQEQFLIVGTQSKGLIAWNEKTRRHFFIRVNPYNPKSLCSNQIQGFCTDDNEGLWIATGMGISYFHPSLQKNKSYHFHNRETLKNGILINAVLPLSRQSFLIGTEYDGLFLYHADSDELISIPGPLTQISSIAKTELGILVGSKKGTFRFSEQTQRLESKPLVAVSTLRIRQLNHALLAFCTQKGLMLFDIRQKQFVFKEEAIAGTAAEKLFCKDVCLKDHKLWILRFFDGWEVREFPTFRKLYATHPSQLNIPVDYHCIQAADNCVYMATSAGIIRQHTDRLHQVDYLKTADGLIGDEIENLLVTDGNQLLYTTVDGLYTYNPDTKKSLRLFSYENYVQKWYNQLEPSGDGTFLYSVSDYFCRYTITNRFRNQKTPSLVISKLTVNNHPVLLSGNQLDLSSHANDIRIYLAGCVYPESGKNRWYYRLNQQAPHISDGIIELQNLAPDDYTLQFYSINNEGVRSASSKTLFIHIAPPFYNTWWFILLLFLFVALLFGIFYFYKRYQNLRLLAIRNQISKDLHDELGANVSSIHILANMLQNDPHSPMAQRALDNISRYSVEISDTINDIIWNVNPQFDSLDELIRRMVRYASETIEAAGIEYELRIPEFAASFKLDNQKKYHLYLIFKESINNAVKHSGANSMEIVFRLNGRLFEFAVKDDGTGFDTSIQSNGNGMRNLQARASEIGATISILSFPGKGTSVSLNIQLI